MTASLLWPRLCLLAAVAAGLAGCHEKGPFERHQSDLQRTQRREAAIDGLLGLARRHPDDTVLRKKVVFALNQAYRDDANRGQIVAALAALKDRRSEEVMGAAVADFARGGEYLEAAVLAARTLGRLGAVGKVPKLVEVLRRVHAEARADYSWLERALIEALGRLGDRRATPALVQVLGADPVKHDFYLSRLAARTLGRLGDPAAAGPLVASLGATAHGLLLFEESRRALCRLGSLAVPKLIEAELAQSSSSSAGALTVLADIGDARATRALSHNGEGPPWWQVARAEALYRLRGDVDPGPGLLELIDRPEVSITSRRGAARVLGWYGDGQGLARRTAAACSGRKPEQQVLCWALVLALSRAGSGKEAGAALDRLARQHEPSKETSETAGAPDAGAPDAATTSAADEDRADRATATAIARYRPRLSVVSACKGEAACLSRWAEDRSWRVQERAVLELSRGGHRRQAPKLARLYQGAHPQVKRAILVALERLAPGTKVAAEVARILDTVPPSPKLASGRASTHDRKTADDSLESRRICLVQRLTRKKPK